jgi:hypothetical protein
VSAVLDPLCLRGSLRLRVAVRRAPGVRRSSLACHTSLPLFGEREKCGLPDRASLDATGDGVGRNLGEMDTGSTIFVVRPTFQLLLEEKFGQSRRDAGHKRISSKTRVTP